ACFAWLTQMAWAGSIKLVTMMCRSSSHRQRTPRCVNLLGRPGWSRRDLCMGRGRSAESLYVADGRFAPDPASGGPILAPAGLSHTAPLSLSANGSEAGGGIVWASCPEGGDANLRAVHGILRAFDASDLSVELWNTSADASRDDVGAFAKFCPPTVANGKVYV